MNEIYGPLRADSTTQVKKTDGYRNLKPLREINAPISMKTKENNQLNAKLNNALSKTPVNEQMPNKASLKRAGFSESPAIDMNGGQYYVNDKVGTIRIASWHGESFLGQKGSSCLSFTSADGKLQNEIVYDPDGNPLKGKLTIVNKDGSFETFEFEYDIDGNKNITSYQKAIKG